MLGDHATVPPDRGIFLPVSRRMHPEVCSFISDQVYEGRLVSHADTACQRVTSTSFPEAGAFWVPVHHGGNAQIAPEEVAAIQAATSDLLSGAWTEKDGTTRSMRETDIIVVAPYNAQVNALREALPAGIRVGTVDKFQGQEAPVCLVSMTASSAEETSRGMEFLFSINRINVAVSRAKGLALVFGAPRLREARCETIEQMRLVSTLCALNEIHS
jgi:superfamily I DNA and/or RNA helicase